VTEIVRRIVPHADGIDFGLREIWLQRHLLVWLGWRDLRIRYRQTWAGVLWAVFQPIAMMLLFTVTLGYLAKVPSSNLPYSVLVLSGLVPWTLISGVLSGMSGSLVANAALITKVYFSRGVIVLSAILGPAVDYAISIVILALTGVILGQMPAVTTLLLLPFGLLIAATAVGPGLWLATLNVRFRDVRFIVPFLLQVGLFGGPVVYPIEIVPQSHLWLYSLNPTVFPVQAFRWFLLGTATVTVPMVLSWLVFVVASISSGLLFLRSEERLFADTI
jgi:lipopolysaccharide transport system permease protein